MLDDIAIFVQIVRSGNLSTASKKLGIPPNTISRRLVSLEKLLGTPLLFRSTRAVRCTPAGDRLYNQTMKSVDILRTTIDSLKQVQGQPFGKTRIQVSTDFFEHPDNFLLNSFFKKFPNIELELIISDEESNLVEEGIDLLLLIGKPKKSNYAIQRLCDVTLGLYASREYLDQRGKPTSIEELKPHSFVKHFNSNQKDNLTLEKSDKTYVIPIKGVISSSSMLGLINATTQGLGISLLHNSIGSNKKNLVRLLPEYSLSTDGLYAIHQHQKSLSTAALTFLEYIIEKTEECSNK